MKRNIASSGFYKAVLERAHVLQYGRLTCDIVNVHRVADDTCGHEEKQETARDRREGRGVGVDPNARRGKQRAGW